LALGGAAGRKEGEGNLFWVLRQKKGGERQRSTSATWRKGTKIKPENGGGTPGGHACPKKVVSGEVRKEGERASTSVFKKGRSSGIGILYRPWGKRFRRQRGGSFLGLKGTSWLFKVRRLLKDAHTGIAPVYMEWRKGDRGKPWARKA